MSNIFDELLPDESPDFTVAQFENDEQRILRERFDSLAEKAVIDMLLFDQEELRSFRPIIFKSGEAELEENEPNFTKLLTQNMLRSVNLDPPQRHDPRFLAEREYKNGSRSVIFEVESRGGVKVPVYFQSEDDGVTPEIMGFMSLDLMGETVVFYRNLEAQSVRLSRRAKISERVLSRLSIDELEGFNITYGEIQRL